MPRHTAFDAGSRKSLVVVWFWLVVACGSWALPLIAEPVNPDAPAADEPRRQEPKRTAKAVTPVKPGGKGRAKALEIDAQQCKEAGEALLLYKIFMSDPETTAQEKEEVRARLEFWEQAARDELARVGKKWVPKPEADKLKEEADKLVAEALELINVENFKRADEKLDKASKIYPDHLDSLFLLGLGAFLTEDYKGADKRFTQCLSRAPNNLSLLNNVAICEVFAKRFDQAVKHWEKAASIEPENPIIVQNVGRFVSDANKSKAAAVANKASKGKTTTTNDFGRVDRRVIDDATDLYTKLMKGGKVGRADTNRGYVVMKLLREQKAAADDQTSPEVSQIVGNGSGFVIWEGFVLTNRHVVEEADGLVIQDPGNPAGEPLPGKVLAVSKELDLAIVQCTPLTAPAAPVNAAAIARGTEVLALGFPVMSVVGKGLKATRGIITGLPSKDTGNLMVLDVQINPGNSGGPLCDKSGRVMGIVAAKTFTERFVQGYGLAIPMTDAVSFIKKHIPAFSEPAASNAKLEWTDVDSQISKSTVLILIKKRTKA
jgi:S1-C subfamily serine protease